MKLFYNISEMSMLYSLKHEIWCVEDNPAIFVIDSMQELYRKLKGTKRLLMRTFSDNYIVVTTSDYLWLKLMLNDTTGPFY